MDEHRPLAHHPTKRSNQLADLAFGLVNRDQEDGEAVRELAAAAGRHRRELRRAAAGIRFTGWADESIEHDRANRLLLAAAGNQPVQPPSTEKMEGLRTLKSLQEGQLESGYEFLAIRQPALRQLDRDVRDAAAQQPETSVELRERILWEFRRPHSRFSRHRDSRCSRSDFSDDHRGLLAGESVSQHRLWAT